MSEAYSLPPIPEEYSSADEIIRLRKELEILKNANPFRMAELALELQIERLRVDEITNARDAALHRLADIYVSIRQKNDMIERLQLEINGKTDLVHPRLDVFASTEAEELKAHISTLESTIDHLQSIIQQRPEQPPGYDYNCEKAESVDAETQTEMTEVAEHKFTSEPRMNLVEGSFIYIRPQTDNPSELLDARHAALAAIPLPSSPPDTTLSPIAIPSPLTLQIFLNSAPVALRNSLSNYKVLQNVTTLWCPDREEHGFMYVPFFKCNTNPKIATAHRWIREDVIGNMNKPTECFYNKEGVWYYAGIYKAFRLDELTTKEWSQLPQETISAIVKETIAGRKNSSAQNTYETTQLYASGALKVACVGLQCVGFNQEVYKSIIDHSIKFNNDTKWKSLATASANVLAAQAAASSATGSGLILSPTQIIAKKPVVVRQMQHRTPSHGSSASLSSHGSPSMPNYLPGSSTSLGPGSSLWNISSGLATPPNVDLVPKRGLESAENLPVKPVSGKR